MLRFEGYFKEAVPESPQEIARTRRISIIFYNTDNTMEITEPRKENSGLVQGPFLKRHKVPKRGAISSRSISTIGAAGSSAFLTLDDLFVGAQINVYGRSINIVDADRPTRAALARMGRPQQDALAWPTDRYDAEVQAQRDAGRGGKPGVNYGSKVTEIKKYCESVSGRFYSDKPLAPFLQNDRKVLRFYCMWDDTKSLHGIRHKYIVHFFLSDDTAEVRERYAANCGSDPWPMLIKRGKLPKNFVQAMNDGPLSMPLQVESGPGGDAPGPRARGVGEYYTAEDFHVGGTIGIWGRACLITGCDEATKRFYVEKFGRPRDAMATITVEEETKVARKRPIPPPTGYGSELDSLQSFYRLVPKQPKKDLERLARLNKKILRYGAKLDTAKPEEHNLMRCDM